LESCEKRATLRRQRAANLWRVQGQGQTLTLWS
jgi:hypothetical protein